MAYFGKKWRYGLFSKRRDFYPPDGQWRYG
jgi:hypothetical protein